MSPSDDPEAIWQQSTEGDLDPDLTDEAGETPYDWHEPAGRPWLRLVVTVLVLVMILALLLPLLP